LQSVDQAVQAAFASAGIERIPAAAACLGLSGAGREGEQALVREWGRRTTVADRIEVVGDATLLLAAGTPEGWGIAVVAGTGSAAWGRDPEGRECRAGGWGATLGDEGSGYALVLAGLRAVTRAADGRGPPTLLTDRILHRFGLRHPPELIPAIHGGGWDRPALAALATLVLDAAEAGDGVALRIVEEGAEELASAVVATALPLGLTTRPVPLALAGGLLLGSAFYRGQVLSRLEAASVRAEPVSQVSEPAEGALKMAVAASA
jgi:N-acetylglucosamine kinase-like BadF-type ATPase